MAKKKKKQGHAVTSLYKAITNKMTSMLGVVSDIEKKNINSLAFALAVRMQNEGKTEIGQLDAEICIAELHNYVEQRIKADKADATGLLDSSSAVILYRYLELVNTLCDKEITSADCGYAPHVSVFCPYCKREAELIKASEISAEEKLGEYVWYCRQCKAYVGVHKGTELPKGQLANRDLRILRIKAHSFFDPIWQSGQMTHTEAYEWLARETGLKNPHIGQADEEQCKAIIKACIEHRPAKAGAPMTEIIL